jgi:hypothetical protein
MATEVFCPNGVSFSGIMQVLEIPGNRFLRAR